jgi:hypothetical protein
VTRSLAGMSAGAAAAFLACPVEVSYPLTSIGVLWQEGGG